MIVTSLILYRLSMMRISGRSNDAAHNQDSSNQTQTQTKTIRRRSTRTPPSNPPLLPIDEDTELVNLEFRSWCPQQCPQQQPHETDDHQRFIGAKLVALVATALFLSVATVVFLEDVFRNNSDLDKVLNIPPGTVQRKLRSVMVQVSGVDDDFMATQ